MTLDTVLQALDEALEALPLEGRAAAAGALAAKVAKILASLAVPQSDRWLTVDEASAIAQAPERRIRTWARRAGVTWAHRPTRKTLRIHEARFRAWLSRDPRLSARIVTNRSLRPVGVSSGAPVHTDSSRRRA